MDRRLDDISPYLLRPMRSITEVMMERKRSVMAVVVPPQPPSAASESNTTAGPRP